MLSVVIRMAFYCIVFQYFGHRGWPSSGNQHKNVRMCVLGVRKCTNSEECLWLKNIPILKGSSAYFMPILLGTPDHFLFLSKID